MTAELTVRLVGGRIGPVDVAVLFAGAARTPLIDGYLTLTAADAAEAAQVLGARTVIPVHAEGWAHFTQGVDDLAVAYRPGAWPTGCMSSPR
jgi:L-ascorbate metabolism protein UlaG (beta-lactamase superfamily)